MVGRLGRRIVLLRKLKFEWTSWQASFSPPEPAADALRLPAVLRPQTCPVCSKGFRQASGLILHLARVHGAVSQVRSLVRSTRCRACLTEFHTKKRMLVHLHTVPGCCNLLATWCAQDDAAWVDEEVPPELLLVDETPLVPGLPPARLPAFRVPGPLTRAKVDSRAAKRQPKLVGADKVLRFLGTSSGAACPPTPTGVSPPLVGPACGSPARGMAPPAPFPVGFRTCPPGPSHAYHRRW